MDCHGGGITKGGISLEGINPDLREGDDYEIWRMVQDQVQFGDMPPKGELGLTQEERETVLGWLNTQMRKAHAHGPVAHEKFDLPKFGNYVPHDALFGQRLDRVYPAPPRVWRLRPEIYDTSIPRIAGKVPGLAGGLTTEDHPDFNDYAAGQFLDEASTAPLLANAKKIAETLIGERSKEQSFKRLANENIVPNKQHIDDAVQRAFVKILDRSATAEEAERFAGFYLRAREIGGNRPAARALLAAVLMQPEVLYRQELGDGKPDQFGRSRLRQQEIAFALSYALGDDPVQLFTDAAERGKLSTSAEVAGLVTQKLDDNSLLQDNNPRVMQFFREYFNYPYAREVFKDQPEGGKHDSGRIVSDLETTIRSILREDRDVFAELLTTRRFYVDAHYRENKSDQVVLTKSHHKWSAYHTTYNLPMDWKWSAENQPVAFTDQERAGILTHPAWLAAWSGNFENHPVQRGKWVRTHLLGGHVPDVPIGVDARIPEKENTTLRDRLVSTTRAPECWRCHKKMDPLGVVFEQYDHYGRFQRFDAGQPVNTTGRITRTGVSELDGRAVDNPIELVEILARSEHAEQVFVRHAFRFFLGRNETIGDANTLQDAHQAYRESGGSFRALIVSLLSSDSFLLREAADTP